MEGPFFALEGNSVREGDWNYKGNFWKVLCWMKRRSIKDALYLDLNLVCIGVKKCQNNQKMFVIMASCEKKSQFWRHCILGSLICLVFYLINIFIFIFQFYVFYYTNILCSCIGGQPKQYLASIGEKFVDKCEKNSKSRVTVNQHPPVHCEGWMISGHKTVFLLGSSS